MVYEYKTEIIEDIGPEPNCNYPSEVDNYYAKINELYHVYAQSAKADEYEAKAKLADKLISELRDSSYYVDEGTKDLMISMCLTEIKRHESVDSR